MAGLRVLPASREATQLPSTAPNAQKIHKLKDVLKLRNEVVCHHAVINSSPKCSSLLTYHALDNLWASIASLPTRTAEHSTQTPRTRLLAYVVPLRITAKITSQVWIYSSQTFC